MSSAKEFITFPLLPAELRIMIWKLCLPHRVVELDELSSVFSLCKGNSTTRNKQPPVISQVCREARDIALAQGGTLNALGSLNLASDHVITGQWFNATTDVIHLNYVPVYSDEPDEYLEQILPYFLSQASKTRRKTLSIMDDLVHPYNADDIGPTLTPFDLVFRQLEAAREFNVCLDSVCIHTSLSVAAKSGLFGIFGEERVVHIDPNDEKTIGKFKELLRNQSKGKHEQNHYFFDSSAHSAICSKNPAKEWSEEMAKIWLYWKWVKSEVKPRPNLSELWKPSSASTTLDAMSTSNWGTYSLFLFRGEPNTEHPFVAEVLENMPKFHPKIMFRLCTE